MVGNCVITHYTVGKCRQMRALAKSFLVLYWCILLFAQDTKTEAVWVKTMHNVGQFLFEMQHSCKIHGPS